MDYACLLFLHIVFIGAACVIILTENDLCYDMAAIPGINICAGIAVGRAADS